MIRNGARRGQRILPRRDWLGGVAMGRKSRRATSAGSESFSQVGGAAAGWLVVEVEVRGTLPAEVSGALRLGDGNGTFQSVGVRLRAG